MNDCPNAHVRDLLPDLVHDRLNPAARADVESHIANCADCQEEIALLRDLRTSMRRTPMMDVSAIAAVMPVYRAPVRRRSWVGWQAAAAITILAAGGTSAIVLRGHTTLPIDTAAVVQPGREVPTPAPAPAVASLPASKPVSQASVDRGRELAIAGGTLSELSGDELAKLLKDIDKMDAVPLTDVESGATTPSIPPRITP